MTYTLCTLIPCGQVVTDSQAHVTLSDGARIHMDCAIGGGAEGVVPRSFARV